MNQVGSRRFRTLQEDHDIQLVQLSKLLHLLIDLFSELLNLVFGINRFQWYI